MGSIRSVIRCTGAFWSTVRLFVAVWPSAEAVDLLSAVPRPAVAGVRWTTPDQWHVTLRFLGEADPEETSSGLRRLAWPGPASAVMGAAAERLGRDVLCLPVAGLDGLAAVIDPEPARPFRGHLTLARRRSGRFPGGVALARGVGWAVDEVTLVASRLRPSGAEYTVLERFPLRPPDTVLDRTPVR